MFHAERFSVRDQTLCSVWNIFHSVHCALRKLDRSNAPVRRRHVFHMESFPSAPSRSRSRRVFRVERSSVTKDQMYSTWNISFQPHDGHPQLYCSTIFDEAVRDSRRERWLCKSRHTFHPCKRRMFHMERFSFSYTIPGDCPSSSQECVSQGNLLLGLRIFSEQEGLLPTTREVRSETYASSLPRLLTRKSGASSNLP